MGAQQDASADRHRGLYADELAAYRTMLSPRATPSRPPDSAPAQIRRVSDKASALLRCAARRPGAPLPMLVYTSPGLGQLGASFLSAGQRRTYSVREAGGRYRTEAPARTP